MLARLDEDLDSASSASDREGSFLRLNVNRSDIEHVVTETLRIVESMSYSAELILVEPAVKRWFPLNEIAELSAEEADVLAARWTQALDQEGIIDDAARLHEPLRRSLLQSFTNASRSGALDRLQLDHAELREMLTDPEMVRVQEWIRSKVGQLVDPE